MSHLSAREPHLQRFRVLAEDDATPAHESSPSTADVDTPLALVRPDPPPERATLFDRFDRWRDDPRARVAVIVVVSLLAGLYWYRSALAGAPTAGDAAVESGSTAPVTTTSSATELVVHVSGAVARPGLLRLEPGARVADAVEAAGGPLVDADLDQLNLAAPLGDGERVHVPVEGEELPPVAAGSVSASRGLLNVNTASAAELEALPGVGPAIAEAIVSERAARPFETVDDLLRVRGIGPSRLEELRPLITI